MMVEEEDRRRLLSALEWLTEDPLGAAAEAKRDRFGHTRYFRTIGQFRFSYRVVGSGQNIVIHDILTDP
jgi:hypothetical protein